MNTPYDLLMHEVEAKIQQGLRHGFFDFRISGEVLKKNTRMVRLHTGTIHQHNIPLADVPKETTTTSAIEAFTTKAQQEPMPATGTTAAQDEPTTDATQH